MDSKTQNPDSSKPQDQKGSESQPPEHRSPPEFPNQDRYTPPDIPVVSKLCIGPGVSQVRRLTREEYKYTLKDLLGLDVQASLLPADDSALGFASGDGISLWHIQIHMEILEKELDGIDLDKLLVHCQVQSGSDSCVRKFIGSFGLKAYRRPLSPAEVEGLFKFYKQQRSRDGLDFAKGIHVLLRRMLQSPYFLYRVELGAANPTKTQPLTPYEIAARLSFLLWKSIPDDALFAAAKAGQLSTPQQIEQQTRRMLAQQSKARRGIMSFFSQWLGLEKIHSLEKDGGVKGKEYWRFDSKIVPFLRAETERFIEHVLWKDDGKFKTLLLANYTIANGPINRYYGYQSHWKGLWADDTWEKRTYPDPSRRMGLLTHPSLLSIYAKSDQSSPVHRGLFIRKQFLCSPPPDPPPNVNMELKPLDPKMTIRKRMEQHRSAASCKGCHELFDTIGFGFEFYDAIGKYQTHDNGHPVDASGSIHKSGNDINGPFTGAIDLAQKMAKSATVHQCFIKQWFRYSFGRKETPSDACLLGQMMDAFKRSDGNVQELIVALTRHAFFSHIKGSWAYTASSQPMPLTASPPPRSSRGCSIQPGPRRGSRWFWLSLLCVLLGSWRWRRRA